MEEEDVCHGGVCDESTNCLKHRPDYNYGHPDDTSYMKKKIVMKKRIVVLGASGFIGGHLVSKLKSLGHWVRGVDIK